MNGQPTAENSRETGSGGNLSGFRNFDNPRHVEEMARLGTSTRRRCRIVQDGFMTETAHMADMVLPAAIWGGKTSCSTNVDRIVHLNQKAIEPPEEARSDLDISLDFARRVDFRDKDGAPLIKWSDAEGAFNAWHECSRGRPCD